MERTWVEEILSKVGGGRARVREDLVIYKICLDERGIEWEIG